MLNILVLAAEGISDPMDTAYPTILAEFNNKTLLQHWLDQAQNLGAKLHLAVSLDDSKKFKLRALIENNNLPISLHQISGRTAGATCTALLSTSNVDVEDSLLILNGNEFLSFEFASVIGSFELAGASAGVVYFDSVHPRYSYVRIDESGFVAEAAEKTPISRNATAGFYWFKQSRIFKVAAENQIIKRAHVDNHYYICPLMNELILLGEKVSAMRINNEDYQSLKSARQASNSKEGLL